MPQTIDSMRTAWERLRPKVFEQWEASDPHEDGTRGLEAGAHCRACGVYWWADGSQGEALVHLDGCPVPALDGAAPCGSCVSCGESPAEVCTGCATKAAVAAFQGERTRARAAIADAVASVEGYVCPECHNSGAVQERVIDILGDTGVVTRHCPRGCPMVEGVS